MHVRPNGLLGGRRFGARDHPSLKGRLQVDAVSNQVLGLIANSHDISHGLGG